MNIAVFFYLLDALQGERKDRSVLFWKSMPVSDTTTVLSKLFTAPRRPGRSSLIVSRPGVVGLLASVVMLVGGVNPIPIWANSQLLEMIVSRLSSR